MSNSILSIKDKKQMVQKIGLVCISFILAACCCKPELDVAVGEIPIKSTGILGDVQSKKYLEHFVPCRNDLDERRVNGIVNSAVTSGKEVVLYFHGGLSHQGYVVKDLGPKLIENVFLKEEYFNKVHPIFFNYDANPLHNWRKIMKEILEEEVVKKLVESMRSQLQSKSLSVFPSDARNENLQVQAANLIEDLRGNKSIQSQTFKSIEQQHDYYISLLEQETLPTEFQVALDFEKSETGESQLEDLANYVDIAAARVEGKIEDLYNKENFDKSKSIKLTSALRVVRILARLALGSDHGLVATIQEEFLDHIGLSKLGAKHWNIVKKHSLECFSETSNGRAIVDKLFENNIKINTLSHSAGAIPVSVLIKYVNQQRKPLKLKNVAMLVPAVNQQVFQEIVIPNDGAVESLRIYVLDQEHERKDDVLTDWLFDASLLYAVSSLGEEQDKTLDQMLLIDQHMKPNRSPYKYKTYLKLACESPNKIWDYFEEGENLFYYPFKNTEDSRMKGATHESTKLPCKTENLVEHYMGFLLDDANMKFSGCTQ